MRITPVKGGELTGLRGRHVSLPEVSLWFQRTLLADIVVPVTSQAAHMRCAALPTQ
jgi:hypothetical protein